MVFGNTPNPLTGRKSSVRAGLLDGCVSKCHVEGDHNEAEALENSLQQKDL